MSDEPTVREESGRVVYRASAVGMCPRGLVAARQGMTPLPFPEGFDARFADGHLHERGIIDQLRGQKFIVMDEQKEVELAVSSGIVIEGHIDGTIMGARQTFDELGLDFEGTALLEIKALALSGYERWVKEGFKGFTRYADQATIYMSATGLPLVYIVKNKNTGKLAVSLHTETPSNLTGLKLKVLKVEKAALESALPPCHKPLDWPCPYAYLHDDKGKADDSEPKMADDTVLDLLARDYHRARDEETRAKAAKTHARNLILRHVKQGTVETTDWYVRVSQKSRTRVNWAGVTEDFPSIDLEQYQETTSYQEVLVKERDHDDG